MGSQTEQQLYKIVAKVLNYKRVHMMELTTKRGSQMLYKELQEAGFEVKGKSEVEWSFIKIFQVMFQDQNHMPEGVKVDPQLVLDVLAFCFIERIMIVKGDQNFSELAVIKGGEAVVYDGGKRPKTLKISLFKIFSPALYNESSPEELASVVLEKAFPKINYTFNPPTNLSGHILSVLQEMKRFLPQLADPKDLLECADAFLRFLAKRGIRIVKTG